MKKFFRNALIAGLLSFSMLSSLPASAGVVGTASVVTQFDKVTSLQTNKVWYENYKYTDITFSNGYTYTESTKNTSSWTEQFVLFYQRITTYRSYRTY